MYGTFIPTKIENKYVFELQLTTSLKYWAKDVETHKVFFLLMAAL